MVRVFILREAYPKGVISAGEVLQQLEDALKLKGEQIYTELGAREGLGLYSIFERMEDMNSKEIIILCNRLALHQYSKILLEEIILWAGEKHHDFQDMPFSESLQKRLSS